MQPLAGNAAAPGRKFSITRIRRPDTPICIGEIGCYNLLDVGIVPDVTDRIALVQVQVQVYIGGVPYFRASRDFPSPWPGTGSARILSLP